MSVALMAAVLAGCGDGDQGSSGDTGPLAVFQGPPSGDLARIEGTLAISDNCVTVLGGDESSILLVWPSEGTTWDSSSRTITYTDGGSTVELTDGDRFVSGGGGGDPEEGGLSATEWAESLDGWVAEPDPTCLRDEIDAWWFVGDLPERDD